jgi:ParB-like chromosome segregation protein Spo0J
MARGQESPLRICRIRPGDRAPPSRAGSPWRAEIDADTWQEYAQLLVDGHALPPVLVVRDGERDWLVDGFHRWHAHKPLSLVEIAAQVREGNALDALRASLRANAEHGKRREPADFRRGYKLAIKHQLVPPTDSEAVADLLRCTVQWARDLTASARERERILEQQRIERGKAEGKSNRQIAREVGVDGRTVRNRLAAEKGKPFVSPHPIEADPDDPRQIDIEDVLQEATPAEAVRATLAKLAQPEVREWHRALEALRGINARPSPAALFLDCYRSFDHAIGPELTRARATIR